jgi:hypothetical protein
MMESARTSETSVDIQLRTRQYIPEDSELHTCRRKNFKSHTEHNIGFSFKGVFKWLLSVLSVVVDHKERKKYLNKRRQ